MALFPQHVATLHADGDIGFSKEYEAIQSASFQEELCSEHSMSEENKNKNRYLNIVACKTNPRLPFCFESVMLIIHFISDDHSRVQLRPLPGQKKSTDYINANYIDGFQQCRGYIGTQGPLPSTFDAFWRMVWEQRVSVIVMITNLVERGRVSARRRANAALRSTNHERLIIYRGNVICTGPKKVLKLTELFKSN